MNAIFPEYELKEEDEKYRWITCSGMTNGEKTRVKASDLVNSRQWLFWTRNSGRHCSSAFNDVHVEGAAER